MKRKVTRLIEEQSGIDKMNPGVFAALLAYTLWYGFKLYRGKDIEKVAIEEVDGDVSLLVFQRDGTQIEYTRSR